MPTGDHYPTTGETFAAAPSLRDQFAKAAMQSLIAKLPMFDRDAEHGVPKTQDEIDQIKADVAASAYGYADAMLANR